MASARTWRQAAREPIQRGAAQCIARQGRQGDHDGVTAGLDLATH